jgi:hypothetical protein
VDQLVQLAQQALKVPLAVSVQLVLLVVVQLDLQVLKVLQASLDLQVLQDLLVRQEQVLLVQPV